MNLTPPQSNTTPGGVSDETPLLAEDPLCERRLSSSFMATATELPKHHALLYGLLEKMQGFGDVIAIHCVPSLLDTYLSHLPASNPVAGGIAPFWYGGPMTTKQCGCSRNATVIHVSVRRADVLTDMDIVQQDYPLVGLQMGDVILKTASSDREMKTMGAGENDTDLDQLTIWRPPNGREFVEITNSIAQGSCDSLNVAFVSFFDVESAERAMKEGVKHANLTRAPPASTVDWVNICILPSTTCWRLTLSFSIIGCVATFGAAPTVLASLSAWIGSLTLKMSENQSDIGSAVMQLIPFQGVMLVNSIFIPSLINTSAQFARSWHKGHQTRVRFTANYVFLILLLFALPLLHCGSILDLVYMVKEGTLSASTPDLHISRCAHFTLQYLISASFTGNLMQLFQLPLELYILASTLRGQEAPSRWQFSFGASAALHLSTCTMALSFASINWILLPCGTVYFTLRYLVDHYLFSYGVRRFDTKGDQWMEQLLLRVFLFQVSIFLIVSAFSFPQHGPLWNRSLLLLALVNALVSMSPSLFHWLPKPASRHEDQLFRIPNMGKFLKLLCVSYHSGGTRARANLVRVPEGYMDTNYPWYISVVRPVD